MPVNVVDFGPVGVVNGPQAQPFNGRVVSWLDGRVVPEQSIFVEPVRDIDAKTRHAPVEPKPQDPVELVVDTLLPPVEVWLVAQEIMEVVLATRLVEGTRPKLPVAETQLLGGLPSALGSAQT